MSHKSAALFSLPRWGLHVPALARVSSSSSNTFTFPSHYSLPPSLTQRPAGEGLVASEGGRRDNGPRELGARTNNASPPFQQRCRSITGNHTFRRALWRELNISRSRICHCARHSRHTAPPQLSGGGGGAQPGRVSQTAVTSSAITCPDVTTVTYQGKLLHKNLYLTTHKAGQKYDEMLKGALFVLGVAAAAERKAGERSYLQWT